MCLQSSVKSPQSKSVKVLVDTAEDKEITSLFAEWDWQQYKACCKDIVNVGKKIFIIKKRKDIYLLQLELVDIYLNSI